MLGTEHPPWMGPGSMKLMLTAMWHGCHGEAEGRKGSRAYWDSAIVARPCGGSEHSGGPGFGMPLAPEH